MWTIAAVVIIVCLSIIALWFSYAYVVANERVNFLSERLKEKERESVKAIKDQIDLTNEKGNLWQIEKDIYLDDISRLRQDVEDWQSRALIRSGYSPKKKEDQKNPPAFSDEDFIPNKAAQAAAAKRFQQFQDSGSEEEFL